MVVGRGSLWWRAPPLFSKFQKQIFRKMQNKPEKTVHPDGAEAWYLNGLCHREDGPAVIWANGTQSWWFNGNRHREDGPAFIWADGTQWWYLNGVEYETPEEMPLKLFMAYMKWNNLEKN